jgi:hypothetical protein
MNFKRKSPTIRILIENQSEHFWKIFVEKLNFWGNWKVIDGIGSYQVGRNREYFEILRKKYPTATIANLSTNFEEMHTLQNIEREQLQEEIDKNWKGMKWDLRHLNAILGSYKKNKVIMRKTLELKHAVIERNIHHTRKWKAKIAAIPNEVSLPLTTQP